MIKKSFQKILFAIVLLFVTVFTVNAANQPAKTKTNYIPIAMATDDNYVNPTVVAMTSVLESRKANTFIDFNIMTSGKVSTENKTKLKKFEKVYNNCSVKLIDMNKEFDDTYIVPSHITTATYYRLALPSILHQYDKVLYLDVDLIVRKDLWDMFSTDLENEYIGGVLDPYVIPVGEKSGKYSEENYSKKLGTTDLQSYVNAGILLMNLKKLREDNMEKVFYDFIPELKKRELLYNDQDLLNATCAGKIKILPKEYNVFPGKFVTTPRSKYDCADPAIVHYAGPSKPWRTKSCRAWSTWDKYSKIANAKIGKEESKKQANKPSEKKVKSQKKNKKITAKVKNRKKQLRIKKH